jgi:hypothetical protein
MLGVRSAIRSFLNYLNGNRQFGDFVPDTQLGREPEISVKASAQGSDAVKGGLH